MCHVILVRSDVTDSFSSATELLLHNFSDSCGGTLLFFSVRIHNHFYMYMYVHRQATHETSCFIFFFFFGSNGRTAETFQNIRGLKRKTVDKE